MSVHAKIMHERAAHGAHKLKVVEVPAVQEPIQRSAFEHKDLATYKVDFMMLCAAGCLYCSTNRGTLHRVRRAQHTRLTEDQLGERISNVEIRDQAGNVTHQMDPGLTFTTPAVIENLERQLSTKPKGWRSGDVLVVSQLTDPFSLPILKDGTTERGLNLILERTGFRVRVLTKMSAVTRFVDLYLAHRDRFVVGLSIGTIDEAWARAVEINTSTPKARARALHELQDAGVATYGMLCPIFPDVLMKPGALDELIDAIRPTHPSVQHVWAEPYNDRQNWQDVRSGYQEGSPGWNWMTRAFDAADEGETWSEYATELYVRIITRARRDGWAHKLRYLLYERGITSHDARAFDGLLAGGPKPLEGVLLQDPPGESGRSTNKAIARIQERVPGAGTTAALAVRAAQWRTA